MTGTIWNDPWARCTHGPDGKRLLDCVPCAIAIAKEMVADKESELANWRATLADLESRASVSRPTLEED